MVVTDKTKMNVVLDKFKFLTDEERIVVVCKNIKEQKDFSEYFSKFFYEHPFVNDLTDEREIWGAYVAIRANKARLYIMTVDMACTRGAIRPEYMWVDKGINEEDIINCLQPQCRKEFKLF